MEPITMKVINPKIKRNHKLKILGWKWKLKKAACLEDFLLTFGKGLNGRLKRGTKPPFC